MREIDGLSYSELASALDVTVPAVKSLLVRARVGLVEAAEAREADCQEIRLDLMRAYDRGVKASGRARRHMRECDGCREYRGALRGMQRSFAALTPVAAGPLALAAKLLGIGGAGAGGSAAAAGSGAAAGAATVGGVSACKVAAVVCTAALTAGGAVEVSRVVEHPASRPAAEATTTAPVHRPAAAAAATSPAPQTAAPSSQGATVPVRRTSAAAPAERRRRTEARKEKESSSVATIGVPAGAQLPGTGDPAAEPVATPAPAVGGTQAPDEAPAVTPQPDPQAVPEPAATTDPVQPVAEPQPTAEPSQQAAGGAGAPATGATGGSAAP